VALDDPMEVKQMHAMVVYDSMFGNTERIAQAIGAAIGDGAPVEVRPIAEAGGLPPGLDLLVVGGPTQGHGVDPALKAFLDGLPSEAVRGVAAAAFDTRLRWPVLLSGSAARGIAKRLGQKGAHLLAEPESFFVEHKDGPLAEGELGRAASWARSLAAAVDGAA
jgi:flavodoxin